MELDACKKPASPRTAALGGFKLDRAEEYSRAQCAGSEDNVGHYMSRDPRAIHPRASPMVNEIYASGRLLFKRASVTSCVVIIALA